MTDRAEPALDRELLASRIRGVPDFPQPGVLFRDITPLLADPRAFRHAVDAMAAPFHGIDHVVAIESRGFILGAPVAYCLGAGLVLVRKVGKLPSETLVEEYALEYGTNTVEIHRDAIRQGERVLIVDDVLATGGTVRAAANLVERLGATVAGISLLIELEFLSGREKLREYDVYSLITY
jgi:adenine phosphoribosyltransferase